MKKMILSILIILISCSQDDNSVGENSNIECNVIGTNGINNIKPFGYYNSDSDTTTDCIKDIVYLVQYLYDSENKLITRLRYESPIDIEAELKNTDNLVYDLNDRVIEISTNNRVNGYNDVKIYEYDDNSDTKPSKINRYKEEIDGSSQLTYIEDITYNNKEQLEKIIRNYNSNENRDEVNYKYNIDGNLTEIECVYFHSEINSTGTIIETFGNYDNYRNPFKNLPFSDLRGISESNNNYLSYSKINTLFSESNPEGYIIESSYSSYEPSNLCYLETSKYQCDE